MNKYITMALATILFTSCAISPTQVELGVSLGTANYLALTKEPQKSEMASLFTMVSALPLDHVVTPAEFQALLNQRLPNTSAKTLTVIDATALYSVWYPTLEAKSPKAALPYITAILKGIGEGAMTVSPLVP